MTTRGAPEFEQIAAGNPSAMADAARLLWRLVGDVDQRLNRIEPIRDRLRLHERSIDPPAPVEGNAVAWLSNGTGTGADGDILATITAGGTTDTFTIVDFSVAGGFAVPVVTKTGAYTATADDCVILCDATSAGFTVTLTPAADQTGRVYVIKKIDSSANLVTIDGDGTETIDGDQTPDLTTQYESNMIVSDGSNWHVI